MKFSTILIGLLLVGGLITGFYTFTAELASPTGYNTNIDSQYNESFKNVTDMYSKISEKKEYIQQNVTFDDPTAYVIGGAKILSLMKDLLVLPFNVGAAFIDSITNLVGLPDWVNSFIMSIFLVLVIFAFMAIILRYYQV